MNFRADTVVQRSCTRDTAGEIRVYRSSFRGIYAPLSFAAHFAALLLLLSREGKGREESARVQKFHEDSDYRPLRYRFDLEGNKDRERESFARGFSARFHSRKGIERGRLEPLSFLRAVQLLSRWLRFSSSWKREREIVATLGFLETSSSRYREEEGWRGRRVSFFGGNVGGETRFGSTGCCSLGSTWQMGGEDSCRGWRGEKGKGASWGREEGKARERLSRRFVATCPLPSAGTRVCTHDTVKLPRQKQLPYRPTVRAANPGQ